MNRYRKFSQWLEWHYRCNDRIIEFSKRHIYDNKISIHPSCKSITLESNATGYLNREEPAVFIDVTGVEEYEGGSRLNDSETDLIVKILGDLDESKINPSEIGVISPYRAQCRAIKAKHGRSRVDVTTVDSFQGREKDVIIFSATSTRDLSFVEDANRINVAFTRARRKLIVVANERSVRGHASLLRKYIEYVGENNAYYSYNHGKIEKSTCPLRYVTNWERESIIFHSLKHEGL
jgi:superfamily I DNA and/or RNA helicase